MAETIRVKAHPSMGPRVGLWERDPQHPDGEVYVAGQDADPVEVAETAAVRQALKDERIVKVTASGKPAGGKGE